MTTSDTPSAVRIEHRSGVVRLVLNRPADGNAFTLDMAREALAALRDAESDPDVHVLTLTGEGRFFCAGGDVTSMASYEPADRPAFLRDLADAAHDVALAMMRSRLLIIAGVNGTAAGAGFGLVLNSDWVLASDQSSMLTAYSKMGLSPDTGVAYLLPRTVGHQRATDLALNSRVLSGADAVDWGLANEVTAAASFAEQLTEVEDRFLSGATQTYGSTKKLLRAATLDGYEEHLRNESASIAKLSGHPETVQRVDRFVGKKRS
ncbi:enoyl-CoA hydratase [Kocuria sp. WRN011]|uniref:enoyl-CoA hydratase/isomerase family protein n=1 Tax=Kocuria sp. WRN011 TaxID=2029858 RepID=UPI000BAE9CF2|nr:enoyl-CoA hydratase/isomerase family protein [Kocuria sp. WRN011]PBB09378.1 enoyl-CoA hydratase [Kocuria sp. WRN011]